MVSADPGAPVVSLWVCMGPSLVGIALVLLLPWRPPRQAVRAGHSSKLTVSLLGLVALAVIFPLLVAVLPLQGENYILGKAVALMALPAALVWFTRGAVTIDLPPRRSWWRWWAPAVAIAVWTVLSQVLPVTSLADLAQYEPAFILIAAIATAITAGIGEELFYRRWLQTRLEAALGPWPAIALSALFAACMHFGSHSQGDFLSGLATLVVVHGPFAVFMGVMWWRYRNIAANIIAHIIANGWGVAVYLLTLA